MVKYLPLVLALLSTSALADTADLSTKIDSVYNENEEVFRPGDLVLGSDLYKCVQYAHNDFQYISEADKGAPMNIRNLSKENMALIKSYLIDCVQSNFGGEAFAVMYAHNARKLSKNFFEKEILRFMVNGKIDKDTHNKIMKNIKAFISLKKDTGIDVYTYLGFENEVHQFPLTLPYSNLKQAVMDYKYITDEYNKTIEEHQNAIREHEKQISAALETLKKNVLWLKNTYNK